MKVKLGMRVDLTETPVASIEASLPKGPGNVNQEGVVSLAKDPRVSDKKVGHVTVTVPSHPGLRTDLDIPFRYDMAYTSDFSGKPGMDGTSGLDGRNGFDGQASRGGSITITYDRSKPFLNIIHLSSRNGPPPVFREAAVAALW